MKILKLVKLETYIGPLTSSGVGAECVPIRNGETAAFDDKPAKHILAQTTTNREGEEVAYFKDVTDGFEGEPTYNFCKEVAAPAAEPEADTGKAGTVQRATRTPPAKS